MRIEKKNRREGRKEGCVQNNVGDIRDTRNLDVSKI